MAPWGHGQESRRVRGGPRGGTGVRGRRIARRTFLCPKGRVNSAWRHMSPRGQPRKQQILKGIRSPHPGHPPRSPPTPRSGPLPLLRLVRRRGRRTPAEVSPARRGSWCNKVLHRGRPNRIDEPLVSSTDLGNWMCYPSGCQDRRGVVRGVCQRLCHRPERCRLRRRLLNRDPPRGACASSRLESASQNSASKYSRPRDACAAQSLVARLKERHKILCRACEKTHDRLHLPSSAVGPFVGPEDASKIVDNVIRSLIRFAAGFAFVATSMYAAGHPAYIFPLGVSVYLLHWGLVPLAISVWRGRGTTPRRRARLKGRRRSGPP
jgi:hypothetical protein